ncbi:MAG TPA: FGGY family carbohydrate kinase, partial [Roseiarcus sp.]|nr:FGGY family carbohydrate kinase [Roseiarcus sp.]
MTAATLVIDQGTTSTRSIVFDADGARIGFAQEEIPQIFPQPGWVEHDPERLWRSVLATGREAIRRSGCDPSSLAAIGVANQRETTVVWERASGRPIANAIVWQDRRTADICAALEAQGCERQATETTGLVLDPYFSATKIGWLLDSVPGARAAAGRGELAFGTVDSFLLWRLTNGAVHATDATNASRTLLYGLRHGAWDEDMLRLFRVPAAMLPEVRDTAGEFGASAPEHFGAAIPVRALIGDQQSALIGQACVSPGMVKATYGTGGFLLLNTGRAATPSRNRLLTTVAYQWKGERSYALEGSIFSAGATVQWLRDGL